MVTLDIGLDRSDIALRPAHFFSKYSLCYDRISLSSEAGQLVDYNNMRQNDGIIRRAAADFACK